MSLNLFIADPNYGKLTSMFFYAWRQGLKTICYYTRTRPAANAIQFTVDQGALNETTKEAAPAEVGKKSVDEGKVLPAVENETPTITQRLSALACSLENKDACMSCSG